MNPTPATTAQPDPGTLKTSGNATATAAASGTMQRIDSFIKAKLSEANSDDGSGILDSAARAARLGFGNAANVRYSAFLDAFRSSPRLTETYQEKYPNSLFLPWPALHAVLKALDLWVDLPEHYRGAVPSEQLPWLEIFELEQEDAAIPREVHQILPNVKPEYLQLLQYAIDGHFNDYLDRVGPIGVPLRDQQRDLILRGRMARPAYDYWRQLQTSFFVVAPPAAFSTTKDWLKRFAELAQDFGQRITEPPPDPLVIRFCRGGCLVVAAWGDEAAALNEMTKELKL